MKFFLCALAAFFSASLFAAPAHALESDVQQVVVGIAPTWDSMQGKLQCFQRSPGGPWRAVSEPVPVLFGKNGLAWGRGIKGTDEPGLHKHERDGRAPAGVFKIGTIYTYDASLPGGSDYPHHTVTDRDAWVDDPNSPNYNKFVTIPDAANPPSWFEKQKMRHNDFAYRWLVEIRHNADAPEPGGGSAIFFHIRRGETRPTSGCTTMAEGQLVKLIDFLHADAHPEYALLPWSEYQKKWQAWGLPDPAIVTAKP